MWWARRRSLEVTSIYTQSSPEFPLIVLTGVLKSSARDRTLNVLLPAARLIVNEPEGVVKSTDSKIPESIRVKVGDTLVNVAAGTGAVNVKTRFTTLRLSIIGSSSS